MTIWEIKKLSDQGFEFMIGGSCIEINTFHNIDCLEGMKAIPDKFIDLIICDPPYGITQCHWDTMIDLDAMWKQYERIIKDHGAILIFSAQPFTSHLIMSNLKLFRYEWIWDKTHPKGHMNANRMPMKAHENICVFYKKLPTYHPQKTYGHNRKISHRHFKSSPIYGMEKGERTYDSTERYPRDVQTFSNGNQQRKINATQKPVEVIEYFMKTYSNPGDITLDNCAGSATTGIAVINLGRKYILMEKDRQMYHAACERLALHKKETDAT